MLRTFEHQKERSPKKVKWLKGRNGNVGLIYQINVLINPPRKQRDHFSVLTESEKARERERKGVRE